MRKRIYEMDFLTMDRATPAVHYVPRPDEFDDFPTQSIARDLATLLDWHSYCYADSGSEERLYFTRLRKELISVLCDRFICEE